MQPRQKIEVEASNAHDRVVRVLLIGNEGVCHGVPDKDEAIIVGGTDRPKEGRACGEEGDVLNIRIVLLRQ